jgi:hypothetical protein
MAYIIDGEPPSDSEMIKHHTDSIIDLKEQLAKERKRITNLYSFISFVFVIMTLLLLGLYMNIIEAKFIIKEQLVASNKPPVTQPCPSSTLSKEN